MASMGQPATTTIATVPNTGIPPASSGSHRVEAPAGASSGGSPRVASSSMKSLQLEEVSISCGELLDKKVDSGGDVDVQVQQDDIEKKRLMWEAVDNEQQVWDAIDDQQKLTKKEERRKRKAEMRQKQDKKKKRKLELEVRRKELEDRRKKTVKIHESNMVRAEGGGSPLATKLSQRVTRSPLARLPLVSSPGVNLMSRIGILASVAASKRRRSLSEKDESSPSPKQAKSVVRSPSKSRSPSPPNSLLGGSKTIHSRGRKVRRLTSVVWRDFNPHYDDGKLVEAEYKHCNEFLPAGRDVGTSDVRRHLATCKIRSDLHLIVEKLKSSDTSHASVLKNWEFDQKTSRQLLARMIILDEMPFSIVEYSGFVQFVKSLNPLFKMVSKNTIKDDCMKLYNKKRSAYCEGFKNYAGRVSLTSDMWTSNQTLGYMCVTIHFIDMNWKLHQKIIRFCMLETPHNGDAMFNILLKSLQEWNIEDKLFSITVDNASVNGKMIDNLRENLVSKNMLHYEGALLHIRCACHVLNLIVQDGLLAIKSVIDNIRESVKYIKSSQTRLDKFMQVVSRVGISSKLPSVDVSTRWNSTYLMLESAFPFRKAFYTLAKEDTNYKFCPSSMEWRRAKTVCSMLKIFHTATQVVSGSTYPTSNLYFHEVWNVRLLLEKEASKKDEASRKDGVINSMVENMQMKFNKYWVESYLANSIPVILDPRFKYGFIEFRLKQAFRSDAAKHLTMVEDALHGLFKE